MSETATELTVPVQQSQATPFKKPTRLLGKRTRATREIETIDELIDSESETVIIPLEIFEKFVSDYSHFLHGAVFGEAKCAHESPEEQCKKCFKRFGKKLLKAVAQRLSQKLRRDRELKSFANKIKALNKSKNELCSAALEKMTATKISQFRVMTANLKAIELIFENVTRAKTQRDSRRGKRQKLEEMSLTITMEEDAEVQ